jgi:pimeloyl-ACP methyl ester carboxylesterase
MSRNLPKARLQIYDDAGHGVYLEKREEFRSLVLEFCLDHGIIEGDK